MHPTRFSLTALAFTVVCWTSVCLGTGSVWARGELPQVRFDVAYTIGCRDVTPEEFAEQNPGERLVEARFQVSTFFEGRDADGLVEFLYVVDSPRKTLSVVDYEPKTTLESQYAGHIGHEKKQEKSLTLGLGLSGTAQQIVNADASAGAQNKSFNTVRYDLLPPLELLAASGTIQRGSGVYFKLKPSPRTTLEGAKEFVLRLRVPSTWRADYLHLTCRA
ncbi:MAG: hypothetical protein J5I93_06100, partial [Pirellulaceae bacterium]|nr:hypothetical protein [Pirellulaceae bacterium]